MSRGLFRSTATIGAMTLISRVLGFVRDMVLARVFGAGAATDAFFVAFKLPNLFRRLFGEGAFASAFVPVFTEYREQRSGDELRDLLDRVAGTLALVLVAVTATGVLGAPLLVWVLAPGFAGDPDQQALTVDLLRITFPYLLFIALVALAGSVLNTVGRFGPPAFTPVLLNLAMIGAALFVAPHFERPIDALAWGVLAGGVLQLAFQWPFLRRVGLLPRPRPGWGHEGVRRIVRLMGPGVLSAGVTQIGIIIDTILASLLARGSVSFLYYAERLMQFPLGLFGIALGTAILPTLSGLVSRGEEGDYRETLDRALRAVVTIGAPASVGLMVLGRPILATLFQYGAFDAAAAAATEAALIAFAAGLPGFIAVKVVAPAFFSRQDTRTPFKAAAWALGVNVVLNLALIGPLAHVGLALATALAAYVNAGYLLWALRRENLFTVLPGWGGHLARVGLALAALAAAAWAVAPGAGFWDAAGVEQRVAWLAASLAAAGGAYGVVAWLVGVAEVRAGARWTARRLFDSPGGGR